MIFVIGHAHAGAIDRRRDARRRAARMQRRQRKCFRKFGKHLYAVWHVLWIPAELNKAGISVLFRASDEYELSRKAEAIAMYITKGAWLAGFILSPDSHKNTVKMMLYSHN